MEDGVSDTALHLAETAEQSMVLLSNVKDQDAYCLMRNIYDKTALHEKTQTSMLCELFKSN